MKTEKPNLNQLLQNASTRLAPLMKHLFFAYILLAVMSVGACVYIVSDTFVVSNEDYRQEKKAEFAEDVTLKSGTAVTTITDRVLELETAGAKPIRSDYVPSRDNPFVE